MKLKKLIFTLILFAFSLASSVSVFLLGVDSIQAQSSSYSLSSNQAYLLDEVSPYIRPYYYKDNNFFSMGGKSYTNGFTCMGYGNNGNDGSVEKGNVTIFNLQGQYAKLSFVSGTVQAGTNGTYTVTVFADGKNIYQSEMAVTDLPKSHTVSVSGCRQLAVSVYDGKSTAMYSGTFGLAEIIVTKSSSPASTEYRKYPSSTKQGYLLENEHPYDTPYYYNDEKEFSMGGLSYSNGFTVMGYGGYSSEETVAQGNRTFFNLDKKYTKLQFTAGVVTPASNSSNVYFRVFVDGKLKMEEKMYKYALPVTYSVDVTGCSQLILAVYDGNSTAMYAGTYGLADIIVTSNTDLITNRIMYRLYNPRSGEHLYTSDTNEKSYLLSIGWKDEGIAWKAPSKSSTPVYRLCNPHSGDHHYTTDASERDYLASIGWNYEGIGWYSADSKKEAVYRLFNPKAKGVGTHHYTTDTNEYSVLPRYGWVQEDIAWYGN